MIFCISLFSLLILNLFSLSSIKKFPKLISDHFIRVYLLICVKYHFNLFPIKNYLVEKWFSLYFFFKSISNKHI